MAQSQRHIQLDAGDRAQALRSGGLVVIILRDPVIDKYTVTVHTEFTHCHLRGKTEQFDRQAGVTLAQQFIADIDFTGEVTWQMGGIGQPNPIPRI